MTLKNFAHKILAQLKIDYPYVDTPLIHKNAYELLIATMLSPQTNDETTNKATPKLFSTYPDVYALAKADQSHVEDIIHFINYYKTKAGRIIKAAQLLIDNFDGEVPSTMDELISLPGVGRKVANVVICEWFAKPAPDEDEKLRRRSHGLPQLEKDDSFKPIDPVGFVIDTHVLRVSQRLHLTKHKTPEKVEQDMMKLFPKEEWVGTSLRMIFHGRQWSQAKNPMYEKHPVWAKLYREAEEIDLLT